MLTRFVRIQLTIFTIASVIGVLIMVFAYIQAPTLLGIGKMTVTLELPETGWALPVLQCDISRRADGQGHFGRVDAHRCESDAVA